MCYNYLRDIMEILADKLRPKKIDDIIGQKHLVGEGKILTNLVKNKKLFSMIFYGKPGIGKTSIATALVSELEMHYKFLNATVNNKSDFDTAIMEAKMYGDMVLIIDEIHRMNKDKQDLLLPYIENGTIILIGLTTSNPYHKINPAIRSRCQIFELHELSKEDIIDGLNKALPKLDNIKIDKDAIDYVANLASGDMRFALNLLEVAYYSSDKKITLEDIKKINNKPVFFHDKDGDGHYDVLSALQKSIRGSDVDASLHYLARLIEAEDLDSIYRRLSVIAYEDIGMANPGIGPRVMAAISAAELVGLPEARIALGQIVVEMALSPKSNSSHLALDDAINDIRKGNTGNVPDNIKTSSPDYLYPHNYPNDWVKQNYMPKNLIGKKYYRPKNNKISVIGLGVYSLAISKMLAKKDENEIVIWTENNEKYEEYKKTKKVASVFDTKLPKNIKISASMEDALENTNLIYIITASKYVDIVTKQMKPYYNPKIPVCIASKGIEESREELLSNIVKNALKTNNIAVISGPTFAVDILNNEPVALALASKTKKAKEYVLNTLANDTLKLRPSKDMIGIQMCGSIKNVIAIASGILSGLGYSNSTQSFLINESLHDIKDIIKIFGGNPKTILSFAGVGDLMLTCTSTKSRNFSFGVIVGSTKDQNKINEYLATHTVEGYNTLEIVYKMLQKKGIEIELITTIYDIVYNGIDANTLAKFLVTKK